MKIALAHDVLNQLGGAERVLDSFLEVWPDATLHTVFYDEQKTEGRYRNFAKKLSFLNSVPFSRKHPRLFVAVLPFAFGRFSFEGFDAVLSDSSAFAKGVRAGNRLHVCYCHTPTRFLWLEPGYLDSQGYPSFLKSLGKMIFPYLKRWDYAAAQRPNYMIANSRNVQARIKKIYNRDSDVIYPPVDCGFYKPVGEKKEYFLAAGRIEPYKRMDIVVEAFNELGWPLKVAGTGTGLEKLKSKAKPNIEFVGRVTDEELRRLYSEAKAFVFPGNEDAGIMPLEAAACGTPAIAYGAGGALETVVKGITGEFFDRQTKESLLAALRAFNPSAYDAGKIREQAMKFDKKNFQKRIRDYMEEKLKERNK